MDFGRRAPALNQRKRTYPGSNDMEIEANTSERPTVSFYSIPPLDDMSQDEFENYALERLKILTQVEKAGTGKYQEKLAELVSKSHLNLLDSSNIRKDNISHFVLRLAFAKNEELRARFLAFESSLFAYRFQQQSKKQINLFMINNSFNYTSISQNEKEKFLTQLRRMFEIRDRYNNTQLTNYDDDATRFLQMKYYKVDWKEVTDLVQRRQIFLSDGYAFVPQKDLVSIILTRFKCNLAKHLALGQRNRPFVVEEDQRVKEILLRLENNLFSNEYSNANLQAEDRLTAANIEKAAFKHFPICMQACHQKLKKQNHLQYHARMQFRLFLKGCGVTMEDSIEYFKREFCKRSGMTAETFRKQYIYNIRHSYGKEGKRVDYTPYSCQRIINGTQPMSGQAHGCPFRSLDTRSLKDSLLRDKDRLKPEDVDYIVEAAERKDFQVACRRHFERAHKGCVIENVGNHPNSWYEESRSFYKGTENKMETEDVIKITIAT